MLAYIIRRVLLIVPTLFGIMVINFVIIQAAPGGPVEQVLAELQQVGGAAAERVTRAGGDFAGTASATGERGPYRGAQGLDPQFIKELERRFGFDKPAHERFLLMMKNYVTFEFGNSFYRDRSVVALVIEKMPVSISLGLWTTFIVYLVSIPLGIAKAVRDGSRFDILTSGAIVVGWCSSRAEATSAGSRCAAWSRRTGISSARSARSSTTCGTSRCR